MIQTLREYAVTLDDSTAGSRKISLLPYKAGTNTFAASGDWTPAAADFKVAKAVTGSGLGAEASIGTAPTWVNGRVVIILSGTELTCRYLTIRIENAAINSDEILVETYGNASAQYPNDYQDGKRLGMTAFPAVTSGNAGALLVDGTGTAAISNSSGKLLLQATQSGVTIPTVTTLTNAPSDSSGITTLLSRLTSTRAGLLDNLDAAISSLNNLSALENLYASPLMEIPDSSSSSYACLVVFRDNEGKLKDLDGSPTLSAVNAAGTDRSANLSSVTHPSTGQYAFTYSVSSAAAEESITLKASGTISAEARVAVKIVAVVNYDSITTLAAIKAKTDQLTFTTTNKVDATVPDTQKVDLNTIKTSPVVALGTTTFQNGNIASTDDTGLIFADVEALLDMTDGGGAFLLGAFANIPKTGYALTSAYDPAKTAAQAGNAMTVSDKTGFKLASDGLDSIATTAPTGPAANFRQMVVQTWRRFFKKATLTASQAKTYADDGTTVITTQTVANDGTTQTQGTAS